ncbi:hypothetical protein H0H81_002143 [Sphagnurus paluster]|uniref:superoxide dismutase n=1 Tax=Sphagnurus paluster TaxID=117069 RepID=A0A9P7FT79_9AGAR|nr:hypothetical protein H0H81_002143 [Sphagnurus paluster]
MKIAFPEFTAFRPHISTEIVKRQRDYCQASINSLKEAEAKYDEAKAKAKYDHARAEYDKAKVELDKAKAEYDNATTTDKIRVLGDLMYNGGGQAILNYSLFWGNLAAPTGENSPLANPAASAGENSPLANPAASEDVYNNSSPATPVANLAAPEAIGENPSPANPAPPKGVGQELLATIERSFGDFDKFKTQFEAITIRGSGWGWLGYNTITKVVEIATTPNHDSLFSLFPLICVNLWEHAFLPLTVGQVRMIPSLP